MREKNCKKFDIILNLWFFIRINRKRLLSKTEVSLLRKRKEAKNPFLLHSLWNETSLTDERLEIRTDQGFYWIIMNRSELHESYYQQGDLQSNYHWLNASIIREVRYWILTINKNLFTVHSLNTMLNNSGREEFWEEFNEEFWTNLRYSMKITASQACFHHQRESSLSLTPQTKTAPKKIYLTPPRQKKELQIKDEIQIGFVRKWVNYFIWCC